MRVSQFDELCGLRQIVSWSLWDNVNKYGRAGQATDDNTAHAHCMLDNYSYRHTLIICKSYIFPTARTVLRTRLSITLYVHCRSCLSLTCLFFYCKGKAEGVYRNSKVRTCGRASNDTAIPHSTSYGRDKGKSKAPCHKMYPWDIKKALLFHVPL